MGNPLLQGRAGLSGYVLGIVTNAAQCNPIWGISALIPCTESLKHLPSRGSGSVAPVAVCSGRSALLSLHVASSTAGKRSSAGASSGKGSETVSPAAILVSSTSG